MLPSPQERGHLTGLDSDIQRLFSALEDGAVVITVNSRLARALREAHAAHVRATQPARQAWPTPAIFSLTRWLNERWAEHLDGAEGADAENIPALLSPDQDTALWERVIAGSATGRRLVQPFGPAPEASRAYRLLCDHMLPSARPDHLVADALNGAGGEPAVFAGWGREFEELCRQNNWVPVARLGWLVTRGLSQGRMTAGAERFLFAGFDEPTPSLVALKDALRARGATVEEWAAPGAAPSAFRVVALDDTRAEIRAAARWARGQLAAGRRRVAIVIPNLHEVRDLAERVLLAELHPSSLAGARPARPVFNLSAGTPLADEPIIHAALMLLQLAGRGVTAEQAGAILRSPFVKGARDEAALRARMDADLRTAGWTEVRAADLARYPKRGQRGGLIHRMLGALAEREIPGAAPAARWAMLIPDILDGAGWPGDLKTLDSRQIQAALKWRDAISGFEACEAVGDGSPLSFADAQFALRRAAAGVTFQPEGSSAPVQVLGALETAGLGFDALWMTGLHDGAWPQPPSPSPYLPHELQVRHGMHNATASLAAAFSKRLVDRILRSAPEVVASWPRRDADRVLRPSRLLGDTGAPDDGGIAVRADVLDSLVGSAVMAPDLADTRGPAVAAPAGGGAVAVRGGTSLFRDQSLCPFRAFARHRLGAHPLDTPAPGLTVMQLGTTVHSALAALWRRLRASAAMRPLVTEQKQPTQELVDLCAETAAEVVAESRRELPKLDTRLADVETVRLTWLLCDWVVLAESARACEFRVQVIENEVLDPADAGAFPEEAAIGGITFRVRRDRVDEVFVTREQSHPLIIDYKTGSAASMDDAWLDPRPAEPQLPLYCVTSPGPKPAIAFGHVRPGECRFREIGPSGATAFPGAGVPAAEWRNLTAYWADVLGQLAGEVRGGVANVSPKPDTCKRCDLAALCRIGEARPFADTGTDEGGAEELR